MWPSLSCDRMIGSGDTQDLRVTDINRSVIPFSVSRVNYRLVRSISPICFTSNRCIQQWQQGTVTPSPEISPRLSPQSLASSSSEPLLVGRLRSSWFDNTAPFSSFPSGAASGDTLGGLGPSSTGWVNFRYQQWLFSTLKGNTNTAWALWIAGSVPLTWNSISTKDHDFEFFFRGAPKHSAV